MQKGEIKIAKNFTPPAHINQEKREEARTDWLTAKETGRNFNRIYRKGITEGFTQTRTLGYVTLDLSQPYQKRVYSPFTSTFIPVDAFAAAGKEEVRPTKIANFRVEALYFIKTFTSETKYDVTIRLCIEMTDEDGYGTGCVFFPEIPLEEYRSLAKFLVKHHPQCVVYNGELFSQKLAENYRKLDQKDEKYLYKFAGWIRDNDGRLKFLHSGMPNVESEVYLQSNFEKSVQFLPVYWRLADDTGKLLILLLFVLWAPLARFFEEKGLEMNGLRAALYLSATSGTGKTTLASLFTKAFLKSGVNNCLRFEDTGPNLEENLLMKRDIPCLIDDFFAQGSKTADAEYEKKASAIMRIAGDGFLRGKLGADRKVRPDRKYRGSIICTGEYVALNTHSSVLRCWQLFFNKGSINLGEEMQFLTRNDDVVRAFVAGWIDFLETNQDHILSRIPEMLQYNETVAKTKLVGCNYARIITHTAALLTIDDLFEEYSRSLGTTGLENSRDLILAQAKEQLTVVEELSPAEIWIRCVRNAVDSGRLNLAEDEVEFRQIQCDGYVDADGVLHAISGTVDALVVKIAYEQRLGLKITETVKKELTERGILRTGEICKFTYKYSKNRKASPHRPRMYSIFIEEEK